MNDRTRRMVDPRTKAEAAFKAMTSKPVETPKPVAKVAVPSARETVSIRLDREVLEHFQADGAGWQERINAALRKVIGK